MISPIVKNVKGTVWRQFQHQTLSQMQPLKERNGQLHRQFVVSEFIGNHFHFQLF